MSLFAKKSLLGLCAFALSACVSSGDLNGVVGAGNSNSASDADRPTSITLTPSPIAAIFGSVTVGVSSTLTVFLSNLNGSEVILGTAALSGTGFTVIANTCDFVSLPDQNACSITLNFSPLVANSYSGALSIPFTSGGKSHTARVSISGIGIAAPVPPSLTSSPSTRDFGSVATNSSSTQTFSIVNTSSVTAVTQTPTVTGPGYTIAASTCTGVTLSTGGSCSLTVRFAPGSTGSKVGSFSIPYVAASGGSTYTLSAALTGLGVTPTTSFSFLGFVDVATNVSNLTATGVRLNWSSPTGGTGSYFKIQKTVGGVTTTTPAITPASATSYLITGLAPNTTYTFRVNAYDSGDVSDGNANDLIVTTPNVTGATFKGWSDVIATGAVISDIGGVDTALGYTGSSRLDQNLAVTLSGTAGPAATVKLAWEDFVFTSSATASGYNIYRSLSAGSGFAQIGTSASATYTDSTVSSSTKYYYKIVPVISGSEVAPALETDSVIEVFVPPPNMALVHRWITNREICTNLLGKSWPANIDRTNQYSCAYDWGLGYGPLPGIQKNVWDIGYSFVIDRWENGCKMTPSGNAAGAGGASGGADGDVYFQQGGSGYANCATKRSGTWYEFNDGMVPAAAKGAMSTNQPGYPQIRSNQLSASLACNQRALNGTPMRLIRQQELIAARAWNGVFHNPSDAFIDIYEHGNNLPFYQGCNTKSGDGLASSDPSFFVAGSTRQVISGSVRTANCQSRYEIQDLIGNYSEWTGEQLMNCNSANSCKGIVSTLDPGATALDGYIFDGVMGPSHNGGGQTNDLTYQPNIVPMFSLPAASVSSTLGSRALPSLGYRNDLVALNWVSSLMGILTDYNYGAADNDYTGRDYNGRFTWSANPYLNANHPYGVAAWGFRCAASAP